MKPWRYFDEVGVDGVTVVRVRPASMGTGEAGQLHEDLLQLVAEVERETPDLVVNLNAAKFLSSATLGALLAVMRKLEQRGGRVVLAEPQPMVLELLELQRMHDLFEVFPSEEEAVDWSRNWRLEEGDEDAVAG